MHRQGARKVVVVGAGLAGLSAASFAARAGLQVELLDAAEAVGGRARSREQDGYIFNQGAHALYRRGPGMAVLRELGVIPDGAPPPVGGAYAVHAERLHTLPTGPLSLLTTGLFGLPERLQLVRFFGRLPGMDVGTLRHVSLDAWLGTQLRPRAADLVRAFARLSTFTNAPDRLSAAVALEQIVLGQQGVLYLHGGWEALVRDLSARARALGVTVRARARVTNLAAGPEGVRLDLAGGEHLTADSVVLAVTPEVVAELVPGATLPPLEAVRVACLDVALRRLPQPVKRFAIGIDRPTYLSVHAPGARLAPEGGAVVHLLRYLGSGPAASAAEVNDLEALLERLQPGWRAEVAHQRVLPSMTVAHALPTAATGGLAGRPDVDALGLPGVFVAGDWVGPEGFLADAALASGRRAASVAALVQGVDKVA